MNPIFRILAAILAFIITASMRNQQKTKMMATEKPAEDVGNLAPLHILSFCHENISALSQRRYRGKKRTRRMSFRHVVP